MLCLMLLLNSLHSLRVLPKKSRQYISGRIPMIDILGNGGFSLNIQNQILSFKNSFYKELYEDGNDVAVRGFLQYNECIKLDCDMRIEKDSIELH